MHITNVSLKGEASVNMVICLHTA